jgi:hypothetical protein
MKTLFSYLNPRCEKCVAYRPSHHMIHLSTMWYSNVTVIEENISEERAKELLNNFDAEYIKD